MITGMQGCGQAVSPKSHLPWLMLRHVVLTDPLSAITWELCRGHVLGRFIVAQDSLGQSGHLGGCWHLLLLRF